MDVTDTFVFIFSIVDGMTLLFLTVYFVSLIIYTEPKYRQTSYRSPPPAYITRMHGSALRCVRSDYLSLWNNGKFDPL